MAKRSLSEGLLRSKKLRALKDDHLAKLLFVAVLGETDRDGLVTADLDDLWSAIHAHYHCRPDEFVDAIGAMTGVHLVQHIDTDDYPIEESCIFVVDFHGKQAQSRGDGPPDWWLKSAPSRFRLPADVREKLGMPREDSRANTSSHRGSSRAKRQGSRVTREQKPSTREPEPKGEGEVEVETEPKVEGGVLLLAKRLLGDSMEAEQLALIANGLPFGERALEELVPRVEGTEKCSYAYLSVAVRGKAGDLAEKNLEKESRKNHATEPVVDAGLAERMRAEYGELVKEVPVGPHKPTKEGTRPAVDSATGVGQRPEDGARDGRRSEGEKEVHVDGPSKDPAESEGEA